MRRMFMLFVVHLQDYVIASKLPQQSRLTRLHHLLVVRVRFRTTGKAILNGPQMILEPALAQLADVVVRSPR